MYDEDEPLIPVHSGVINDVDLPSVPGIPNRIEMVNISWVFLFASATLTAGFIFLHAGAPLAANQGFVNGTFLVSCVAWLYGFGLLIHWVLALPGALDKAGLVAAGLKFIASFLFCVQPFTALLNQNWGCDWSNLAGICFFHVGNVVSVFGMRSMFSCAKPFSRGNLPVFGMWQYLIATTHLVLANTLFYAHVTWLDGNLIAYCQIAGGLFLCFGSLLYIIWSQAGGCF